MRTPLKKQFRLLLVSAILIVLLEPPAKSRGAEPSHEAALPPGSLVFHGTPKPVNQAVGLDSTSGVTSPEYLFGLKIQQAMATNGVSIVTQAVDLEALYRRFVPTLPVSDNIKQQLYAMPRDNAVWRLTLLKDIASEIITLHLDFLGLRTYGPDVEILFRDVNAIGGPYYSGCPLYIGYVTQREPDGTIRIIDVHRFLATGELMSQTLRRRALVDLARKGLVREPLNASDSVLLGYLKPFSVYEIRYNYGHYDLLKAAYDQLPAQLQDDPYILFQKASCGVQSINDVLSPIERWHKLHPDDPGPYLLLVDSYWRLFNGPINRLNWSPSPEDEQGIADAIQKANVWFDDPAMEVRLARYYGTKQPVKARPLLIRAIQRKPPFAHAFSELLNLDLSQRNYTGVAETLHLQEIAFQTNLTAMVNSSVSFLEFRKSAAFKKWQHDDHIAASTAAN